MTGLGLVLLACSGRMDVGFEEVGGSGGSGASSGGEQPMGSAGDVATGATAGTGSMTVGGSSGAGQPDACAFEPNELEPDARPLLTSHQVLTRLYVFLESTPELPVSALPPEPTADWVAMHASRILDEHAEAGTVALGLERFLWGWLGFDTASPHESPERWALRMVEPEASLSTLLAGATDDPNRIGILSELEFLSQYQSISARGAWMSANLLCQEIPPPPANTPVEEPGPGMTRRQQLESLHVSPACTGCHRIFDPLGFSLEYFDELGVYRELDNGLAVDAAGTLEVPPLSFESYADLAPQLATSCEVGRCFTELLATHALGRALHMGSAPLSEAELNHVAKRFYDSGLSIRALVDAIVRSPSFLR